MAIILSAKDQFDLMWQLSKHIDPKNFPTGKISYFIVTPVEKNKYKLEIKDKTYTDEMSFMLEVSSRIAGQELYGIISQIKGEVIFGFRGHNSFGEFTYKENQWTLREYEDFKTRSQSRAEVRLEVGTDLAKLKKIIA
ncbi:hypothetical protein D3C87_102100 [compost metagenome]